MLAPWKRSYDRTTQHIKKQRHNAGDKDPYCQSYGFSSSRVERWELDHKGGWAPKSWCFQLWCLGRLLRISWTARRSNQSVPKEISPEYSLEGQVLKLKLQFFGQLIERTDSLEKTLMLGKIEGRRRWGWQDGWLDSITNLMDTSLSKPGVGDEQGSLACCSPWGCKELGMTEWLNWADSIYRFGWKAITQIK